MNPQNRALLRVLPTPLAAPTAMGLGPGAGSRGLSAAFLSLPVFQRALAGNSSNSRLVGSLLGSDRRSAASAAPASPVRGRGGGCRAPPFVPSPPPSPHGDPNFRAEPLWCSGHKAHGTPWCHHPVGPPQTPTLTQDPKSPQSWCQEGLRFLCMVSHWDLGGRKGGVGNTGLCSWGTPGSPHPCSSRHGVGAQHTAPCPPIPSQHHFLTEEGFYGCTLCQV